MKDTYLVGIATLLNMVAVATCWVSTGSVPEVLGSSLTALVGATAALAYTGRRDNAAHAPEG